MKISRRELATIVAAASASAGLWACAEAQVRESGEVTRETALALLDAAGPRGIFEDEDELQILREALANHIGNRNRLQEYELPPDTEPAITFAR
jgi:hypothetical protein